MVTQTASSDCIEVLKTLEGYFHRTAPASAPKTIEADTQLLGSGLLDSLSMLELTMFLSDEFGIEFADDDFTPEHFITAGSLAALVAGKRAMAS